MEGSRKRVEAVAAAAVSASAAEQTLGRHSRARRADTHCAHLASRRSRGRNLSATSASTGELLLLTGARARRCHALRPGGISGFEYPQKNINNLVREL